MSIQKKSRFNIAADPWVRESILKLQGAMIDSGCPKRSDGSLDKIKGYRVEHRFAKGMYIRECHVPAGMIFISELHKYDHPYFMLKGSNYIISESGSVFLKAPCNGITKAGTKRIIYVPEDTIFITCHATESVDVEEIESEIIAKSYEEFELEDRL